MMKVMHTPPPAVTPEEKTTASVSVPTTVEFHNSSNSTDRAIVRNDVDETCSTPIVFCKSHVGTLWTPLET